MGTKDLSFVQLNQLIGRKTGGISVYPMTSSVRGKEDPCSHLIVRGKAMAGRADDLFNLVAYPSLFLFRIHSSTLNSELYLLLLEHVIIPEHFLLRQTLCCMGMIISKIIFMFL